MQNVQSDDIGALGCWSCWSAQVAGDVNGLPNQAHDEVSSCELMVNLHIVQQEESQPQAHDGASSCERLAGRPIAQQEALQLQALLLAGSC